MTALISAGSSNSVRRVFDAARNGEDTGVLVEKGKEVPGTGIEPARAKPTRS